MKKKYNRTDRRTWLLFCFVFMLVLILNISLTEKLPTKPREVIPQVKLGKTFLVLKPTPPKKKPYVLPDNSKFKKFVYLTFDDGPWKDNTKKITNILKKNQVRATFFVNGVNLDKFSKEAKLLKYPLFSVQDHTWYHYDLRSMSDKQIVDDTKRMNSKIKKLYGKEPTCVRPPYGAINSRVRGVYKKEKMRVIIWNVDPTDWARPGVDSIVKNIMHNVKPNSIILEHDGGGDRSQTAKAMKIVIPKLKKKGYGFKFLCE